ncbi:hypothetical protein Tco_0637479 [Tanacetum coccineum]
MDQMASSCGEANKLLSALKKGSAQRYLGGTPKSIEDAIWSRPGKGEQVDGNSMESSKSTEEESEDEIKSKQQKTARFCLDVEVTEKEIERMVMEALRAEYIANDKFNHQLYEPEGMKNNYNSLPHYQVEARFNDVVPVIPEPVLVDEDEDPKEEEFEEEEEPQEEEDMDIDDEEDKNEPELTFSYEEADPLNPPPPASDSEPEDAIEVEDMVEPEDDTVPASVHEVGESSMITKITKPESIKELELLGQSFTTPKPDKGNSIAKETDDSPPKLLKASRNFCQDLDAPLIIDYKLPDGRMVNMTYDVVTKIIEKQEKIKIAELDKFKTVKVAAEVAQEAEVVIFGEKDFVWTSRGIT